MTLFHEGCLLLCPYCEGANIHKRGFEKGKQRYHCNDCVRRFTYPLRDKDIELVEENIKLARHKQRYQDQNRIERKSWRNNARFVNTLEVLAEEVKILYAENNVSGDVLTHRPKTADCTLLAQVSDLHINELVKIVGNEYGFEVAKERLSLYAQRILEHIEFYKPDKLIIAFTGDMINSDRRLDEILAMAYNRAQAMFKAVDMLSSFLLTLNRKVNIDVYTVVGNESRIGKEMGWTEKSLTDNFDYMIHEALKRILEGKKGIQFIDDHWDELVIPARGHNILILHGYSLGQNGVPKDIQSIRGKWASKGRIIHHVMFGHQHSSRISDTFSRSGSLVGANAYSDSQLQFESRASQNLHIIRETGIDTVKIDLQTEVEEDNGEVRS